MEKFMDTHLPIYNPGAWNSGNLKFWTRIYRNAGITGMQEFWTPIFARTQALTHRLGHELINDWPEFMGLDSTRRRPQTGRREKK
jgi:hypothetical protein